MTSRPSYFCIPLYVDIKSLSTKPDIEFYVKNDTPVISPLDGKTMPIAVVENNEFTIDTASNDFAAPTDFNDLLTYLSSVFVNQEQIYRDMKIPSFESGKKYVIELYFKTTTTSPSTSPPTSTSTLHAIGILEDSSLTLNNPSTYSTITNPSPTVLTAVPSTIKDIDSAIKNIATKQTPPKKSDNYVDNKDSEFVEPTIKTIVKDAIVVYEETFGASVSKILGAIVETDSTTISKIEILGTAPPRTLVVPTDKLEIATQAVIITYIQEITGQTELNLGKVLTKLQDGSNKIYMGDATDTFTTNAGGSGNPKNISFSKHPQNKSQKNKSNNSKKKR